MRFQCFFQCWISSSSVDTLNVSQLFSLLLSIFINMYITSHFSLCMLFLKLVSIWRNCKLIEQNSLTMFCLCGGVDAELSFEPNSTTLYSGEHVNFTCHMREANVSEWYYEFKWNDKPLVPITSTNVLRIPELTPERNGDYQCIAHHNSSEENKRSNRATLSVSGEIYRILVTAGKFPHRHVEIQDKEKYK